ncbi:MBL fold metallo-hydrolase [Candidatus Parcubacteria bacterium]|nr:MBL fold metallo-hydrolase [Candidatus Parcubacteria bacterium]
MIITWYGQFCFQITTSPKKGEQVSIVIDPFEKGSGLKLSKIKTDILLSTHDDSSKNEAIVFNNGHFLITSPGEYEAKGIFVHGISVVDSEKKKKTTIYTMIVGGIRICHLGNLSLEELSSEQMDQIGEVDILMISIGGGDAIDSKQASKIIKQIEPRLVVPMNYNIPGLKVKLEELQQFLNVMGIESAQTQNKLSIKKKDLPTEKTTVMVIKP